MPKSCYILKRRIKHVTVITLTLFSVQAIAQKRDRNKLDTIYYLADTSRVPKNDRMLTIGLEVLSVFGKLDTIQTFRINCKCLVNGYYPTFTRHLSKIRKVVTKQNLKKIRLTSLPDVLNIVQKDYDDEFYYKHVIIIIERVKKQYFEGEVFLTKYGGPVQ